MKFKEILDILEDIMTIIVSVIALSGTWIAYERGFFHKVDHIFTHYHTIVEQREAEIDTQHQEGDKDIKKIIQNVDEKF